MMDSKTVTAFIRGVAATASRRGRYATCAFAWNPADACILAPARRESPLLDVFIGLRESIPERAG